MLDTKGKYDKGKCMNKAWLLLFIVCLSVTTKLFPASAGALDITFNPSGTNPGVQVVPVQLESHGDHGVALQADGMIVAVGFNYGSLDRQFAVVRNSIIGEVDTSFGIGGIATAAFGSTAEACSVAVQTDGKIVVVGIAYNSGYKMLI